jgi:integrase
VGRLAARQVNNAKPKRGLDASLLADGGNLYLQLTRGDGDHVRRSWLFRYELNGRRREMGLGALHTRGLKEARAEAKRQRLLLLDGVDPIDQRKRTIESRAVESAKHKTFADVAAAYLKAHKDDWKNPKHAAQWQTSLTKECKAIARLPVAVIDTAHVLEVLEPIWKIKPETASRVRGRIERVLAYAIVAKYRKREDGNPARWDGHLEELLGSKAKAQKAKRAHTGKSGHHPALPYKHAPDFLHSLRRLNSTSARALEFTILTAARTSEVIGATWHEIDFADRTWTIPADRMKMKKQHKVPLSDRALDILKSLPRHGDRIFSLSDMAMLQCLRGLWPGLTVHGFRSTFMDWAHEQTGAAKVVIDMALAHAIGDKVEAAYRRGDLFERRKRLMQQWSEFCRQPVATDATVTPLRKLADA